MSDLGQRSLRVAMTGIVHDDDPHIIADMMAEIERLRGGIQKYLDGNYGFDFGGSKVVKCPHGQYRHEICEGCIDGHFVALLKEQP